MIGKKGYVNPVIGVGGVVLIMVMAVVASIDMWQDRVVMAASGNTSPLAFFGVALTTLAAATIPMALWLSGGDRLATMIVARLGWKKIVVAGLIVVGLLVAAQVCQCIPVVAALVGYRWLYGVGQFAIRA